MSRRFAPLAVALAALGLAACGSSHSHSSRAAITRTAVTSTPTGTGAASTPTSTAVGSTPTSTAVTTSATGTSTSVPPQTPAAFKTAFANRRRSFQALGVILGKLLQAAPKLSNARLASDFTAMAQAIAAQQTALAKIVPPAQYTGPYDDLIATFSPVAVDLGSIAADARTGNATSATSDTEKLIRDAAKLKNAERALAKTLGLGT